MSSRSDFLNMNEEYQKCLNKHYDKFFEGQDVEINDDTCQEFRENLKKIGSYYPPLEKEYIRYEKEETAKTNKN